MRVLITGASRGIGRACVESLACVDNAMVLLCGYRDSEVAESLAALGPNCIPVRLDVTDPSSIAEAHKVIREGGRLASLQARPRCLKRVTSVPFFLLHALTELSNPSFY